MIVYTLLILTPQFYHILSQDSEDDDPYCQQQGAQDCAHCATYGPCLNSADPHCITHKALSCLSCEAYANCSSCAVGWDIGCIATAPHENTTKCDNPDITTSNDSAVFIPYSNNNECYYHPVWESYFMSNCKTGEYFIDCRNDDCTNCSSDGTLSDSDPSISYNVNISSIGDEICLDTTALNDENETESTAIWGICGLKSASCTSGSHCGPDECDPSTNFNCAEIEIFYDDNSCEVTSGAGVYAAYVIVDNTCRMDGSGRSYYQIYCSDGIGKGVLGCDDSSCNSGCLDIGDIEPNTCVTPDWSDGLQIVALINETHVCSDTINSTMRPSSSPTVDLNSKGNRNIINWIIPVLTIFIAFYF